jgi:hypothetical protein
LVEGDGIGTARRVVSVSAPVVTASEDSVTPVAGTVLWGPLLDRLGLIEVADRRGLRPIGPGGYGGGICYRSIVELQLAGGDFLSDRSLLADEATARLRTGVPLPSHTTLYRFVSGADLGRVSIAAAVNRTMLARAWAMGAAPASGLLTIDVDATLVNTFGSGKQGAAHSYRHEVGLSPLLGICGETGDVLALRARGGSAYAGRALGSFLDEAVTAIPAAARGNYQLWVRSDSAGYIDELMDAALRHNAVFTITTKQYANVRATIEDLACDPDTVWQPAIDMPGSEIAECLFMMHDRDPDRRRVLRMIVRRQPIEGDEQLSFDDLDGWRFYAIVTNLPGCLAAATDVEHHHRLRGGAPEEAIRQLKHDFALNHAPVQNFFGNWLWWHASALAYNIARWIRRLALPASFERCRAKRLRLAFFNVAGRVVRHGRRLHLRLPRAYAWADAFIEALTRIRTLPRLA